MRAVLNFACFLAALALTSAAISHLTPLPYVPIVSPKLAHLAMHGDEFDVLFLGSSRTYRQILPELFDRLMAEAGHPVKSFNLGIDGMRPPEDTYVLEQTLASRRKPLRLLIVESNALRLTEREDDEGTLRAGYWHDTKRTATLFRRTFLADEKKRNWRDRIKKIAEAMPQFAPHAGYWAEKSTATGRGHDLLASWLFHESTPPIPMHDIGPRRDGYNRSPHPDQMPTDAVARYQADVAKMKAKPPRVEYSDRISQAEVREKQRLAATFGARTFLVVPPFVATKQFAPEPGPDAPPVLSFSDPNQHPELFAVEHHSDSGHVNRAGSELYTRAIARELLSHLSRN